MPPRPGFGLGLKIVTDVEKLPDPVPNPKHDDADAWEVKPDGTCSMLGKSLKGQYVFSQEGLVKAAGQDAPHNKVSEQDIMFIKTLGAGACATVHKGFHNGLRKFVAVKRVSVGNKEVRQQMLRDIKILSDAQQVPGLLSFLGAYYVPKRDQMAVVLEYMDGGTLADVLKKLGRLPEDVMAHIAGKLLQGLVFMHAKHMVHRDIKPANILMSLSGDAKLSDFGISATVDHTLAQCMTYAGTVTYMSPERLEGKPYNFKADIWSLGLVLLECLTGRYPFDAAAAAGGPMELIIHVLQDEVPLPPPGSVSDLCRDFLSVCLSKDPAKRPPAALLLGHPWVAQAGPVNLRALMKQTMSNPDDRLEEISCHFSSTYYSGLSKGELYASLYLEHSVLSYEGVVYKGQQAILSRLQEATRMQQGCGARPSWTVASVDSQALLETGCVMVHVMGRVQVESSSQPAASFPFTESFILHRTPAGEYYISNQAFRLMPR